VCLSPHDHHGWIFCVREPGHKGKHGALAAGAGNWIGNRPAGSWVVTWGSGDEAPQDDD
jgi:hypothetical protein